jgi:DNA-binding NtrC family response regulator
VSPNSTVLLLSIDAMTLGLLGLLVEVAGFKPVFARDGERAEDAIVRLHAVAAVLVDDLLDAVRSDVFFAWAAQHRVPLVVFAGKGSGRNDAQRIRDRGIAYIEPAISAAELAATIRRASSPGWWQRS